ncbi:ABC transporter substrate-binding protein [Amycolatopsis sp. CA-161197]|uniref:ABC transporter substrate-binding protein n=1 Tax=Amycolatopsis sp. CA-161197 TaxID=3239922 RepID=UPI003D8BB38C
MGTRIRRRAVVAAAVAAVAAVSSACGSSPSGSAGGAAPPLVVYSAQGYTQGVLDAFSKATGVQVKLVSDSTGPLLAKVAAERSNPQWGVLWADGDAHFAGLDTQGMLLKGVTVTAPWTASARSVIPKDASYVPTGLTLAGALVYDPSLTPAPPKTWQELTSAQWRGKVGMPNPAISGPTYPFVAGTMSQLGGEDQGKAFFSQLKTNGLQVFDDNPAASHALATGSIQLDLAQSSSAYSSVKKNPALKIAYLNKVSLLPSNLAIAAKAPAAVQDEAKKFLQFVVSPAGQRAMLAGDATGDSLYWPPITGVDPLPALPALDTISYQTVDPYAWGPKESEIDSWFTQNIVH